MKFLTYMAPIGSYPALLIAAVVAFLVYCAVYRVTLHPLAMFPGPRLAALSSAYQARYDLGLTSSYVFKFPELHEKYGEGRESHEGTLLTPRISGPIVRITPNQLHVCDIAA